MWTLFDLLFVVFHSRLSWFSMGMMMRMWMMMMMCMLDVILWGCFGPLIFLLIDVMWLHALAEVAIHGPFSSSWALKTWLSLSYYWP
jgi:hypothetical protein